MWFRGRNKAGDDKRPKGAPDATRVGEVGHSFIGAVMMTADYLTSEVLDALRDRHVDPPPEAVTDVQLQSYLIVLHFVDRIAHAELGPFQRRVFVDALLEAAGTHLCLLTKLDLQEIATRYNQMQRILGKHKKLFPGDDGKAKNTLLWECAKMLVFRFGLLDPEMLVKMVDDVSGVFVGLVEDFRDLVVDSLKGSEART